MAEILIIEDEKAINELLMRNLTLVGHSCMQAFCAKDALSTLQNHSFDLVILDIMLPDTNGFNVIKQINDIPVIFLTAKGSLHDKVHGLNLGADDYITKPFEILELLARVQAVLRRTKKEDVKFVYKDITVDLRAHRVYHCGKEIEIAPQEFELLHILIINRNIALSRDKLLELAWGFDYLGDTRTVDVHIQKLRSKLGWDNIIKTVYKVGYRLEV